MNSPKTARTGNRISAAGMVIAVAMAFIHLFATGFSSSLAIILLVLGILIGSAAGVYSAKKVKMTDMPQLVSVFNTVGGGAAALVALNDILTSEGTPTLVVLITAGLGVVIGSITFTGSLIAAGKLQGIGLIKNLKLPAKAVWNVLFALLTVLSLVMLCLNPGNRTLWAILTAIFALGYGLVFVIPIGGADMVDEVQIVTDPFEVDNQHYQANRQGEGDKTQNKCGHLHGFTSDDPYSSFFLPSEFRPGERRCPRPTRCSADCRRICSDWSARCSGAH